MSETASTGGAPAAAAAPASTGQTQTTNQTSGQNPSSGAGQAPKTGGVPQGQAGPAETAQDRFLAEQDLDAYIEHTINGRKEKIKVRDALNGYGLDKTARQKMSEAAQIRQQHAQLNHLMKTDFDKYCQITGINKDEFLKSNLSNRYELAEELVAKKYELSQMDPHQREALELKQQIESMKSREMQTKQPILDKIKQLVPADRLPQGIENASVEELHGFYQARQQEFNSGLDSLSNEMLESWQKTGLPKEKDIGAWMAQLMLDHQRQSAEHKKRTGEDLPPLHPDQAAVKVKTRFLRMTQSILAPMDAPAIQEFLGEAIIQKLRTHDIGLASQQNGPNFGQQNRPAPAASEPKQYLNQTEWRKAMGFT